MVSFGEWFSSLSANEKRKLAERVDRSIGYLRHLAKRRKTPSLQLISSLANNSNGALTVEQLAAEFAAPVKHT